MEKKSFFWRVLGIPLMFFIEFYVGCFLCLLLLSNHGRAPTKLAMIIGLPLSLALPFFCLFRSWRRVQAVKKSNGGRFPWKSALAALVVAGLPAGLVGYIAKTNFDRSVSGNRQSGAKLALNAIYGQEKVFLVDRGAGKFYSNNFDDIGFTAEANIFYVIGFPPSCGDIARKQRATVNAEMNTKLLKGREAEVEEYFQSLKVCRDPKEGFDAYAIGIIRPGAPLDVWRIDEQKRLENIQDGH